MVQAATDFPDPVRRTTLLCIDRMQSRGALIRKLWAELDVARSLAGEDLCRRERAMRGEERNHDTGVN